MTEQRSVISAHTAEADSPSPQSLGAVVRSSWVPVLAICAVVAWFTGLRHVSPADLDGWGLIRALSPSTLLAYPILAVAMAAEVSRTRMRPWMLVALTAIAIGMIYGLQPTVETVARSPVAWLHAGFSSYIIDHGHVLEGFDARFSWPGFFALVAMLASVANLDPTSLLNVAPVVFMAISAVAMRAIAAAMFGARTRASWIAVWIFIAADWTEQDYFSPQAIAYVLMLVALALTVRFLVPAGAIVLHTGNRAEVLPAGTHTAEPAVSHRLRIAAQLVVISIAVCLAPLHQLTPYALVVTLTVLWLWRSLRARWLVVLTLVPPLAWLVLGARDFWVGNAALIFPNVSSIGSTVSQGVTGRVAGDFGHEVMTVGRVVVTAVVVLAAGIGWLLLRRDGHKRWLLPALALSPFALAVVQPYGGEGFIRSYLYALPWLAVGTAVALDKLVSAGSIHRTALRTLSAGVVMAAIMLSTVVLRGGNDAYVGVTRSDVEAVQYIYDHAEPGDVIAAPLWSVPLRFERLGDLAQGAVGDPGLSAVSACAQADFELCLLTMRPEWIVTNPQVDNAGHILYGRPEDWSRTLIAELMDSGYSLVFERNSVLVLRSPGAP